MQEEPQNMGAWRYLEAKLREAGSPRDPPWTSGTWEGPNGRARRKGIRPRMLRSRAASSGKHWKPGLLGLRWRRWPRQARARGEEK